MRPFTYLTCVLFLLAPASVDAEAEVKQIDRRNMSESNKYFVTFCARTGSAFGHAFVVLGQENAEEKVSKYSAFGLYPKSARRAVLGTVPGNVVNEVTKGSLARTTDRLIVRIDSSQYETVENIRKKWAKQTDYKLLKRDCVTFTAEIAQAVGLKVPGRNKAKLPQTYIKKMMGMNQ